MREPTCRIRAFCDGEKICGPETARFSLECECAIRSSSTWKAKGDLENLLKEIVIDFKLPDKHVGSGLLDRIGVCKHLLEMRIVSNSSFFIDKHLFRGSLNSRKRGRNREKISADEDDDASNPSSLHHRIWHALRVDDLLAVHSSCAYAQSVMRADFH